MIIAIDGPAASGKSTIAKRLAAKLNFNYLDTGAMYRALTWKVLQEKINPYDEDRVVNLLKKIKISQNQEIGENKSLVFSLYVDGEKVDEEIRSPLVSQNVSLVSKFLKVRRAMVKVQRKISKGGNIVVEGRDIGTVVFPHADFKFFLTATLEERARRRAKELQEKGIPVDFETLKKEIVLRDKIDSSREHSPLKKAKEAIVIDSTNLTPDAVIEKITQIIKERRKEI